MKFAAALATLALASGVNAADTCNSTDAITYSLSFSSDCSTAGITMNATLSDAAATLAEAVGGANTAGYSVDNKCSAAEDANFGLTGCNTTALNETCPDAGDPTACYTASVTIDTVYATICTALKGNAFGIEASLCATDAGCFDSALSQCKDDTDNTTKALLLPLFSSVVAGLDCSAVNFTTPATLEAFCDYLLVKPTGSPTSGSASAVTATLGSAMIVAAAAIFA